MLTTWKNEQDLSIDDIIDLLDDFVRLTLDEFSDFIGWLIESYEKTVRYSYDGSLYNDDDMLNLIENEIRRQYTFIKHNYSLQEDTVTEIVKKRLSYVYTAE